MPRFCAIQRSQDVIGGKWTLVALWHLRGGPLHFGELQRAIGEVSQKALAQTLRHLERSGIISRTVQPTRPPRVAYALTSLGRSLEPLVQGMEEWAARHRTALDAARSAPS